MGKLIPIVSPAHLGLQASSAPLNIGAMLPKSRLWGSLRILPCGGVAAIVIGCVWGKRPRVPRLIVCAAHTYGKKPRASLLHHSPILLIDTSLRITTTKKLCPLLLSAVTKHDHSRFLPIVGCWRARIFIKIFQSHCPHRINTTTYLRHIQLITLQRRLAYRIKRLPALKRMCN